MRISAEQAAHIKLRRLSKYTKCESISRFVDLSGLSFDNDEKPVGFYLNYRTLKDCGVFLTNRRLIIRRDNHHEIFLYRKMKKVIMSSDKINTHCVSLLMDDESIRCFPVVGGDRPGLNDVYAFLAFIGRIIG